MSLADKVVYGGGSVFCVAALVLVVALTTGCENQSQSRSTTWTGQSIETIAHDGHTFVVSGKGGIIHHPGCACQK